MKFIYFCCPTESVSERHKDSYSNNSDSEKLPAATIHYISTDKTSTAPGSGSGNTGNIGGSTDGPPPPPPPAGQIAPSENYSYVTLTAVHHDYNYPVVEQPVGAQVLNARRESISALKKRNALEAAQAMAAAQTSAAGGANKPLHKPNVSDILKKETRLRCRYCHELYSEDFNRRGACEYAPDPFRSGYECISGMGCARCMIYHCMSDAEGETAQHPCDCSVSEAGCTKRWLGLALLSLFVPCLWCYPPLRACHWMGIQCGLCGARHKPHVWHLEARLQGHYDDDPSTRPRNQQQPHSDENTYKSQLLRLKQRQSQLQQPQPQRHFYNWELSHSLGAPQQQPPQPLYLMQPRSNKAAQNDYGRLLFWETDEMTTRVQLLLCSVLCYSIIVFIFQLLFWVIIVQMTPYDLPLIIVYSRAGKPLALTVYKSIEHPHLSDSALK